MMVAIDELRQHHLGAATNSPRGVLAAEFLVGADFDNSAGFLKTAPSVISVPVVAVDRMSHHGATADHNAGISSLLGVAA